MLALIISSAPKETIVLTLKKADVNYRVYKWRLLKFLSTPRYRSEI